MNSTMEASTLTTEPNINLSINTTGVISRLPPLIYINNILANKLLPLTVILWIYLVVGVLGNSLVMFVYWARKKPVREDRYFIPVLALVDMASCVVSSSTGIYAQTYPLMFDNDVGCKMAAFLGILLGGFSANFLIAIAIERYLKICRPFGRQMTKFLKKLCIILMAIVSLAFAAPSLRVYRSEQVPTLLKGRFEIQTWKCIDKEHEAGQMVYKVLLSVLTLLRFLVLLLCYGNVIWVIFRQKRMRIRMGSVSSMHTTTSSSHDVEDSLEMINPNNTNQRSENNKTDRAQPKLKSPVVGNKGREQSPNDLQGSKRSTTSGSQRRRFKVDRQGVRLTVIFILITSIYIITYGLKAWLMIMQTLNHNFWSTVPSHQLVFYRFLHSFYIFNNIVNPIVYAVIDSRFRMDCKKRFTKCK
ncbi:QRFP-like peptide receptor [Argopecten irradians]|uniref:QRFP-like peptide receptor n=1 Tax=Argopecten irradians TaxID=31199 RepID=UPI0037242047